LVGLPNAGKSTFLSSVTRAKPKIADYPFTTLEPKLGVTYIDDSEFIIADIPGLIENAHIGKGLGHKFLKHIERCRVILHLIDPYVDDVVDSYKIIRKELENYSAKLKDKLEIIAISKSDILTDDEIEEKVLSIQKQVKDSKVFIISAVSRKGIEDLLREVKKNIINIDEDEAES